MDGQGTETMATAGTRQPDRPFHRRIGSPATGHAHHFPGAPPDVPPAIAGAVCRSNGPPFPPHGQGQRHGSHADPHTAPYLHPDDRDGIPALIRSRLIGSLAVSGADSRSVRSVGGHAGNAEEGGNANDASADDGEDHLPCLRGHYGLGDPEGRVEPSQDCGYEEDQRDDKARPERAHEYDQRLTDGQRQAGGEAAEEDCTEPARAGSR